VNESPECFTHKNGNWSFEFRNPATGERIMVVYAGPTMPAMAVRQNWPPADVGHTNTSGMEAGEHAESQLAERGWWDEKQGRGDTQSQESGRSDRAPINNRIGGGPGSVKRRSFLGENSGPNEVGWRRGQAETLGRMTLEWQYPAHGITSISVPTETVSNLRFAGW
jgi:hypothetical protein